jgi:hypothetical protein
MEAGDMALGNSNAAGSAQSIFLTSVGADPAQSYGFGLIQTIPSFGKLSALYVPSNGAQANTTGGDKTFVEGNSSAVELGFVGDLGVKGLNVHLFRNEAQKVQAADANKLSGSNYGLSYNFGTVTVGIDRKETNAIANASDITQNAVGVSFAVNPNVSLAANYTIAEKEGTTKDAEARSIAVGYNLGAVAIVASYSNLENILGTAGADRDVFYLAARTSF